MVDQFGRNIHYLRISVTDHCNLNCNYCVPSNARYGCRDDVLRYEEILRITSLLTQLGIDRVRITGGEPLVRKNITELLTGLRKIPGIQDITMTTNGILLEQQIDSLLEAGITGINISLDTLKEDIFKQITGSGDLKTVKRGILCALDAGISVKLNCVLQKGINDGEILDLAAVSKDRNADIRFIEMMPIGQGRSCEGISNEVVLMQIKKKWPDIEKVQQLSEREEKAGPAVYYKIPDFAGRIGFISAVHTKFCKECNRLRLTAEGILKPCLASGKGTDLKPLLRNQNISDRELYEIIKEVIFNKPKEHCFESNSGISETKNMYQIGG